MIHLKLSTNNIIVTSINVASKLEIDIVFFEKEKKITCIQC